MDGKSSRKEPAMHRPRTRIAAAPRDRAFWIATSVLLLGQLIAFWTVCSQQVSAAAERHASEAVERVAVAQCLRTVPGATLASCAQRVVPPDSQLAIVTRPANDDTVPVNYVYAH
jgi:hypothetical protein